jgi:putative Mn2+ efflux pump MntP
VLRLIALLLPLSLDTFAVAAALGAAGLAKSQRSRISVVFVGFETVMPLIGIGIGQTLGHTIGSPADYLAGVGLLALGGYLLFAEDDEADAAATMARTRGIAVIGLGISIGLDELAIGFSAGLLGLPLLWAIVLIAIQALIAVRLGLRFGSRLGQRLRERTEQFAGFALIALGVAIIAAQLI